MLTNLDFLNPGQPWLPDDNDTKQRFDRYNTNKKLFNNGHVEVYEEKFKRISRVIGNFEDVISYPTIINFQKLMSLKIADLLFGEEPKIVTENQEELDELLENLDCFNKLYESAIDTSRYGDGILNLSIENDRGSFEVGNPCLWIPIVDPFNIKKIVNHVIAWQYSEKVDKKKKNYLRVHIHFKGYYLDRLYTLSDTLDEQIKMYDTATRFIISELVQETTVKTGLDDFAIIHIPNVLTSDRITGYDDYMDVDSIISEILVRISQIEKILDKHADPSMEGSMSACEKDPASGEWKIKMGGKFFMRDSMDSVETKYITWDGQLEAAFKSLELLLNQLYIISELGSVLLGGEVEGGGSISGRAMRMRMISPLAKAKRLASRFEPSMKKLMLSLAKLNGLAIDEVSITWQDGLPNDPVEEAEVIASRTGQKATMSQRRVLTQYDGLSEEEAEKELERILEDEKQANPMVSNNFDVDDDEEMTEVDDGE